MNRKALDELKQQVPLLDYLQAHDWQAVRSIRGGRLMGLCPLHTDHKPSFVVNPGQNLFYCYGCARGGDVIRFAELYHQVKFPQAVTLLREWCGVTPLLEEVTNFYRMQLSRHREAVAYLEQRGLHEPEVIEHMRIGYAPGRCLRAWLNQLGYPLSTLRQAGLVDTSGCDAYSRRIVFPLEGNLYGRSILDSLAPHRFLPAGKGGLYAWEQVRRAPEIILVEGLFDYAVLWQAGFHNVTCSLGNHLNARQFLQLCDGSRTVYLAFDADANGSGQSAAQQIQAGEHAEGLEVTVFTGARESAPAGNPPVGQGDQIGPQRLRFPWLLREDVRQPAVREIDHGQPVPSRVLGRGLARDAPALDDHQPSAGRRRLGRRSRLGRRRRLGRAPTASPKADERQGGCTCDWARWVRL